MSDLRLDICLTAMQFAMDVEYTGPRVEGAIFKATCVGTAITQLNHPL